VEAFEVEIEVDARWGKPDKIAVVGLPDTAVKESRDRVTSAIGNSSLLWPIGKGLSSIWPRPMFEAKGRHRETLIVPAENAAEAGVVEGVNVYAKRNWNTIANNGKVLA
jgi:magnesium chelatase family protein